VSAATVRGDAVLLCVGPGGGRWRSIVSSRRIAGVAVLSEAALRRVVEVERGRLVRGPAAGHGALGELADRVNAESKPRKLDDWLHASEEWALAAVARELEDAGVARRVQTTRALGVVPSGGLELLDPGAQQRAAEHVRTVVDGSAQPTPDSVLLTLLLAATDDLKHHAPGTSTWWAPWSARVPRGAARRLRRLRDELPPAPREVVTRFERYCKRRRSEYVP
jgi:Golgi phosphoprotein 3 (GPP34)